MPPKEARFLIVDDMSTMRKIIRTILNQLGYTNVEEAENGKEAWLNLEVVVLISCLWTGICQSWTGLRP